MKLKVIFWLSSLCGNTACVEINRDQCTLDWTNYGERRDSQFVSHSYPWRQDIIRCIYLMYLNQHLISLVYLSDYSV